MNMDREESKKLAEAFASLAETAVPRRDCPEADRIYAAVLGELEPEKTRAIVSHTAGCPVCAEAWRLARAMPAPGAQTEVAPVVTMTPRWRRVAAHLALAASLLLFSILAFRLIDTGSKSDPSEWRNGGSDNLLSLTPEDQALPRGRFLLRWRLAEPEEGARFEIRVTTEDVFQVIATGRDLEETEFLVEEARLADLPPGATLLWWVRVSLPDGRQFRSKTFTHRLR